MIPILLGAGAALTAFFLSGCTENQDKQEPTQAKPIPSGAPADASVPASAPPQPYYVSFGNNIRAAEMYQRLSELGTDDEVLDRGCPALLDGYVPPPGMAKDRRIEACEVYHYALNRHREYPEVVAALTGNPIPWSLGELLRESVQKKIDLLEAHPALLKYEKGSEEYRKRLGTALAFYVDAPNVFSIIQNRREELREKSQVLVEWGMKDFQEKLLTDGGLGGLQIAETAGNGWIGSAEEAWNSVSGGPSARAKLLYAVLDHAGVDPVFLFASTKSNADLVEEKTEPRPFLLSFGGRRSDYLQVGIPLASTNPQSGRPDWARFKGWLPEAEPASQARELSLMAYLALDFHERADFEMLHSQGDPGVPYKIALNIAPTDSAIFNSIAVLLERMQSPVYAEIAYKEALRFDPQNASAAYNLGSLYERQESFEKAVRAFRIPAGGTSISPNRLEAMTSAMQKVLAKDPKNPDALALEAKIKALSDVKPAEAGSSAVQ